jgi:hypothetical protein
VSHCTAVNGILREVCEQEEYEIRQCRVALVLTTARREYEVEYLGETHDTGMEHLFPKRKVRDSFAYILVCENGKFLF